MLANAGDIDAGGTEDLLVGEPLYDSTLFGNCSRMCVYSGRTFALLREHPGSTISQELGYGVAAVGDLDFDGYADYAAESPDYNTSAAFDASRIYVFSGRFGTLLWAVKGSSLSEYFER